MKSAIVNMTPEMAKYYLQMNVGNRNLRSLWVNDLKEVIKRGEWQLSPQGISISDTGYLLDGQHRLTAIKESGMTVPIVVWTDVEDDIFKILDRGASRTLADVTKINQKKVEILNMLSATETMRWAKKSADQILRLNDIFGAECDDLLLFAPTVKKGFSTASAKAAVVILMKEGFGEHAKHIYRQLTLLEFDGIPEIAKAYVKQVLTQTIYKGSSGTQASLFVLSKALQAFDSRNHDRKQIAVSDSYREQASARVNAIISQYP